MCFGIIAVFHFLYQSVFGRYISICIGCHILIIGCLSVIQSGNFSFITLYFTDQCMFLGKFDNFLLKICQFGFGLLPFRIRQSSRVYRFVKRCYPSLFRIQFCLNFLSGSAIIRIVAVLFYLVYFVTIICQRGRDCFIICLIGSHPFCNSCIDLSLQICYSRRLITCHISIGILLIIPIGITPGSDCFCNPQCFHGFEPVCIGCRQRKIIILTRFFGTDKKSLVIFVKISIDTRIFQLADNIRNLCISIYRNVRRGTIDRKTKAAGLSAAKIGRIQGTQSRILGITAVAA